MSKNQSEIKEVEKVVEIDIEAIKAQLREEVKAEIQARHDEEVKALEDKIAADEAKAESSLAKAEVSTKAWLKKQPKTKILIPENPQNPNEVVPVVYNGVIYSIPVGQEFEVPKPIYDTWKYSYDMTRAANKKMQDVLTKEIKIM